MLACFYNDTCVTLGSLFTNVFKQDLTIFLIKSLVKRGDVKWVFVESVAK